MKLHALGIDLGKTVFHLVGLDSTGRVVIRKRCSRRQLLAFTAHLQVQLIGLEACSGSHFLGRALREQGHEVRLMPAQYESPWQRGSNENTNGLLRQYLPKNADLSTFSQSELDEIALRLNTRPRQTLGFQTPADKPQTSVASTP